MRKTLGNKASLLESGRMKERKRDTKASDMGVKKLPWKLILRSSHISWYHMEQKQATLPQSSDGLL